MTSMDFQKSLRQAWSIAKTKRSLWLVGLFIFDGATLNMLRLSSYAVDFTDIDENWFERYWPMLLMIGGLVLLLGVVAVFLHYIASAGLVFGVNAARQNTTSTIGQMFGFGIRNFWRVWLLDLVLGLLAGAMYSMFILHGFMLFTSLIGLIVLPLYLLVWIFSFLIVMVAIYVVRMYTVQYILIDKRGLIDSLRQAMITIKNHFSDAAISYGVSWLAQMGSSLVIVLAGLLISLPFAIVGFVAYSAGAWLAMAGVIGLGAVCIWAVVLLIGGIRNAYIYTLWNIAFAGVAQR